MIELKKDKLVFSFPEVHPQAKLTIDFQRTLRIPDDGEEYPLPPGLGKFPLRHVDDYPETVPPKWIEHGGVMLPMYQSEALWLKFKSAHDGYYTPYPFAIKVATGKINAITGKEWSNGLHDDPQDYMIAPKQPWLDGYCVKKGQIRQFVAMPLGEGYSVEEQLTKTAEHGGLQIVVYPMKKEAFERRFSWQKRSSFVYEGQPLFMPGEPEEEPELVRWQAEDECVKSSKPDMAVAPGGRMQQEIYEDPYDFDDWDLDHPSRCFVHLANSLVWRAITNEESPTVPFTAKEYTENGFPWFDYYDDSATVLKGSEKLGGVKSVKEMGEEKGGVPLPENEPVRPEYIIKLRKHLKKHQVREGVF